jgi:hypothetical protein
LRTYGRIFIRRIDKWVKCTKISSNPCAFFI